MDVIDKGRKGERKGRSAVFWAGRVLSLGRLREEERAEEREKDADGVLSLGGLKEEKGARGFLADRQDVIFGRVEAEERRMGWSLGRRGVIFGREGGMRRGMKGKRGGGGFSSWYTGCYL